MSEGAISAVQVSSSGDLNCKVTVAVADGDESEQCTAGLLSGHGDWGEGCGKDKGDSPGRSFPTSLLPCPFISAITQRRVGVLDLNSVLNTRKSLDTAMEHAHSENQHPAKHTVDRNHSILHTTHLFITTLLPCL